MARAIRDLSAPLLAVVALLALTTPSPAASIIGNSTSTAFHSGTQFYSHFTDGHYWVAYHNGFRPVLYSSPDALVWTLLGPIFLNFDPSPSGHWAVRFAGKNIIAFGYKVADQHYYRSGTLNRDGTVTWNAAEAATGPVPWPRLNALVANGKPILWRADAAAEGALQIGSQLNGPTWTNTPNAPPLNTGLPTWGSAGAFSAGAILQTGGADPNDLIVLRTTTAPTYSLGSHRLVAIKYDAASDVFDGAWYSVSTLGGPLSEDVTTEVQLNDDDSAHRRFAAVRDTSGSIHAIFVNRNNTISYYKKDAGFNDSWSRLSTNLAGRVVTKVALTAAANNNLYLFYNFGTVIYSRRFNGTIWGVETVLYDGSPNDINDALGALESSGGCPAGLAFSEGIASPYDIKFALIGQDCSCLQTRDLGSTITVETTGVKMVWDAGANAGGGLAEFYGKTEPNSSVNRSGTVDPYNVVSTQINDGAWLFENGTGALFLLETTPTRVKVRQGYNYTATIHLSRDWTAYAYPRLAISEILTFDNNLFIRGVNGINTKGDSDQLCPVDDSFFCQGISDAASRVWVATDDSPTYSDMLLFPYDESFFGSAGRAAATPSWEHLFEDNTPLTPPISYLARVREQVPILTIAGSYTNNYLFYPSLAGLSSFGIEWQPYERDYRNPDTLTINGGMGEGWFDPTEFTAVPSDYFNEAENAYTLDFNPTSGLNFSIDGAVPNNRKHPFFKIRSWRSLSDPTTVKLGGTTLANDLDYKADVKPFSRAHFCAGSCTELSNGGLVGHPAEFLADGSAARNFTLAFAGSNTLYLGSDSKFRGINVALQTAGVGDADLRWEYWDGITSAWTSIPGLVDQTNDLRRRGTIYWTSDPPDWSPSSISGGPALFYVRAYLASGGYVTPPVEGLIKTDILLFQYCGDITLDGQTFDFALPVPTAVELVSFEARAADGAVGLSWETAAEVDNLGFYLYRGPSERGPFDRISATLIPGLGSSPLGAGYRYRDSGLTNGRTYFYLLEDIETTGVRTQHGPISATPEPGAPPPTLPAQGPSAGMVYGEPEETSFRVLESNRVGVILELLTGGFTAEAQPDGSVRLSLPGFVEEQAAIPVKRVWLDAVVGRKVRLVSVEATDVETFSSLRPSGTEIPELIATPGVVRAVSRQSSPSNLSFPEDWARLVTVAFQEQAKKALLELAPIRWDGTRLLLARRLKVRVVFTGREIEEESFGGSWGRRHREISSHRGARVMARLLARERGLYRVSFEELLGLGGRPVAVARLRLSHQGKPVAYHLERAARAGRADRRFGPGSLLYFFSHGASLNPYGDRAVYELTVGEEAVRMPLADGKAWGTPTGWYWRRVEREENRIYHPALLEAEEPWLWDTLLAPVVKAYRFAASRLAPVGESARLELWLQGASDFAGSPDHHVRVFVNGSLVAEESWDGKKPRKVEAELGAGVLREGENDLSVENVADTKAISMVMLERFTLVYPRLCVAEGGVLEGHWSESGVAEVHGLAGRALVLDVTEEPPRWLTAVEPIEGGMRFGAEAGRKYLAVGAGALLSAEVTGPAPSGLKSERNVAEYLVLGPAELLLSAGPLLELRRSQGLRSKAVPLEEVYSEFGYGEERPEAIRDFLAYAYHHWAKPSPRYVLLLGDATYDFKDYLRTGVKNLVPPYLLKTSYWLTASDPFYASVNGEDDLADLAIGRLPAKTAEEARALVEKVVAYETGEAGLLRGRAVLVVDNPDRGGDFEADAQEIAASLLAGRPVETIYVRELGRDGTRAAIGEAFDRGASLMSYLGHGAILVWASENVFNNLDVRTLSAQEQQPFLLTMNCLNGYFHFPYLNSLSEELLKAEGRGAIAAFAPSGLSLNGPAHRYHKALVGELLSGKRERLGDVVLAAQAAYAEDGEFLELLSIYHLLGDPALTLR